MADIRERLDAAYAAQEPDRVTVLEQKIAELETAVQILSKTLEGVQHLFIRAGEYQGKPRGRLPR